MIYNAIREEFNIMTLEEAKRIFGIETLTKDIDIKKYIEAQFLLTIQMLIQKTPENMKKKLK